MKTKVCSKCGVEKPFSDYYKMARGANGLRPECKQCFGQYECMKEKPKKEREARKTKKLNEIIREYGSIERYEECKEIYRNFKRLERIPKREHHKCSYCDRSFLMTHRQKGRLKRGSNVYCSEKCVKNAAHEHYAESFVSTVKNIEVECLTCGDTFTTTSTWYKKEISKGHTIKCKRCGDTVREEQNKINSKKHYENNKESLLEKARMDSKAHPEKYRERRVEHYANYKQKIIARKKIRRHDADSTYVKYLICKGKELKYSDIPDDFVDLYRKNLLLKRELKNLRSEENEDTSQRRA